MAGAAAVMLTGAAGGAERYHQLPPDADFDYQYRVSRGGVGATIIMNPHFAAATNIIFQLKLEGYPGSADYDHSEVHIQVNRSGDKYRVSSDIHVDGSGREIGRTGRNSEWRSISELPEDSPLQLVVSSILDIRE